MTSMCFESINFDINVFYMIFKFKIHYVFRGCIGCAVKIKSSLQRLRLFALMAWSLSSMKVK